MKNTFVILSALLSLSAFADDKCLVYDEYFLTTTQKVREILKSKGYTVTNVYPRGNNYFVISNIWDMDRSILADVRCVTGDDNYIYTTRYRLSYHADDRFHELDSSKWLHAYCEANTDARNELKKNMSKEQASNGLDTCADNIKKYEELKASR
jgi:hypothetical protein